MKILFIISTIGNKQGRGGHYYSLKTTFEEVNKQFDCIIINVGRRKSPVIDSINGKIFNITYKHFNPVKIFFQIKKIFDMEKPDVIHSFDVNALFFARLFGFVYKTPRVHTKCGGPNPPRFYPYVKNFIFYSQENYDFFKKSKKFSESNLYLIPNRIAIIEQDFKRINEIKLLIKPESKVFLRIARLSSYYQDSIFQSINLIKLLNQEKISSQLIIIGTNQDDQLYKELSQKKDDNVIILTDDYFTLNASELIDISDFVIGTGRSFMEAASRGKVLLAPLQRSDIPLLITKINFREVMSKNFSERTSISNYNKNENLNEIINAIQLNEKYDELSFFIKAMSSEYFEIQNTAVLFKKIYSTVRHEEKIHIFDFLIHFAILTEQNIR